MLLAGAGFFSAGAGVSGGGTEPLAAVPVAPWLVFKAGFSVLEADEDLLLAFFLPL